MRPTALFLLGLFAFSLDVLPALAQQAGGAQKPDTVRQSAGTERPAADQQPAGAQQAPGTGNQIQANIEAWGSLFFRVSDPEMQLTPIFLNLRDGDQVDPVARAVVGADLTVLLQEGLSVGVSGHFDTDATNSHLARTGTFHDVGARAELDQAYLTWAGDRGALTVGRRYMGWGPSPLGGLALSGHAPAPDLVHGRLDLWGHSLESMVARLSTEGGQTRLMYATRVVLNLHPDLTLGLTDMTITAQRKARLVWPFLVPWIPNAFAEWRSFPGVPPGDYINSQVGVDLEWRPGPRIYGEWFADDARWHDWQDTYPHRWAFSLGLENQAGPWTTGYEYRRIMSWTYTHFSRATEARNYRWPLSAPEGPDTDRHVAWARRQLGPWEAEVFAERRRRGENWFGVPWDGAGHRGDPFPTGRVENRWVFMAGLGRSIRDLGTVRLDWAYHAVTDVNNLEVDGNVSVLQLAVHLGPSPFAGHRPGMGLIRR